MQKRSNLQRGANALLISHLREKGGSAVVNSLELSTKHGLSTGAVGMIARHLKALGLLKIEHEFYERGPTKMTLNEEAIREFEASGSMALAAKSQGEGKRASLKPRSSYGIPQLAAADEILRLLNQHEFAAENQARVDPLIDGCAALIVECRDLEKELLALVENNEKLMEAARGFGASDEDLKEPLTVPVGRFAGVEYKTTEVPGVKFEELLSESAKVFKPLAQLMRCSKELRGISLELQRRTAEAKVIRQNLQSLVDEFRVEAEAAVVDVSSALAEWRHSGDRVLAGVAQQSIAVVSTSK